MSTTNCGCDTTPICPPKTDCSCKVRISTDCVTLAEDLTCSNILKGQTETEVLKQLDAYICSRFNSVTNFLQLINVGGGSEIYKGDTLLGKKQLRTLVDSGLINLTQGVDTITITVDEVALGNVIKNVQKTYTTTNIGLGAQVYKNSTVVVDNTQFNLRKIKSSDSSVSVVELSDDIDITVNQNNFVRVIKINENDLPIDYDLQDVCDYILALPAVQRTLQETDSKLNIVIEQNPPS